MGPDEPAADMSEVDRVFCAAFQTARGVMDAGGILSNADGALDGIKQLMGLLSEEWLVDYDD